MSHSFIDRSSNYFTQNYENEEPQKKIDPIAQLKELNNTTVREWGLFNNHPAQMFAKEEDLSAEAKAKEEEETIQGKGLQINNSPVLEDEADIMGTKAAHGENASVYGVGNGIQKQDADDVDKENGKTVTTDYETYKSKTFKASDNAKLYSLTESDGKISVDKIYEKEKNYAVESEIIPKDLKVSILETDNCYNAKTKSYKEVAKIKVDDSANSEWNGRVAWTTRTNVSEQPDNDGFYTITVSDANVRADAVEVNGNQKTIPQDTEITISEYRENNGKYYLKVADKETTEEYGWIKSDGFMNKLANVSFGVTNAVYISEEENHSTINKNNTKTFEENGYKYESIKEKEDFIRIPKGTKVKVISTDDSYREVEQTDGTNIGWTSVTNLASKADEDGFFEVTNDDARIRRKEKNYKEKTSTLSVGTFVIEKETSSETYPAGLYTKVALTEKNDDKYTEKADSDVWILTDNLTRKWADVKGKHATWEDGKYTGQIDLVNVMGDGEEMEYMKADTNDKENDMYDKYIKMANAAESDGVIIGLVDGFRTYPEQKVLYDAYKANKKGYYPANPPGKSDHQRGIAVDLSNKGNSSLNKWLMKNSYKFGFVRTYSGYSEGHHWEYRPSKVKNPTSIKKDNKEFTRYYFATFTPEKEWKDSDTNKWDATYYEE